MLNDDELLCRSLEFGVGENTTGIYDDHGFGCGKGLACIANIVKKSCGSMEIVSGNAALKVDGSGVHTIEGCCFPGTAIGIVFSTDGSHEISEEDLFVGMENSTLLKDLVEDYRSVDGIDENGSALLW